MFTRRNIPVVLVGSLLAILAMLDGVDERDETIHADQFREVTGRVSDEGAEQLAARPLSRPRSARLAELEK
jgi:hypothetical protein